jgi:hypothetical protein
MASVRGFALLVFFGLWAVIGYTDWTHQKIRHNLMLFGGSGALLAYAGLLALTLLGVFGRVSQFPYWGYYQLAGAHFLLSAAAAMALWWLAVWPAGDAKLFILLAALYPVMGLNTPLPQERLFLSTLINIFIPAAGLLFLRAVYYVYDTRLRHNVAFLRELGWKRELHFFSDQTAAAVRDFLGSIRPKLRELLAWAVASPLVILGLVFSWLTSMAAMSVFSYYLKDFFESPLKLTLIWTVAFMLWQRFADLFGKLGRYLIYVPIAALLLAKPPHSWGEIWHIFQNISIFSFFLFLGMTWAFRMLSGGSGIAFALPFVLPFAGIVFGQLVSMFWDGVRFSVEFLRRAGASGHPGAGRAASDAQALIEGARGPATSLWLRASDAFHLAQSPTWSTLFILAAMGLFFGLSLVMVRLWDQEVRPVRTPETLAPYLLLAPAFVDRIRQDPEFFSRHFRRVYADGLTADQARALKAWCRVNSIDVIPLAPTMSFAGWIFFGYFLSFLLGGAHVLEVVL